MASEGTSTVWQLGLYTPFTFGGTIVVDDVVASVHSDWFLDPLFDWLNITHLLPATYQVSNALIGMWTRRGGY